MKKAISIMLLFIIFISGIACFVILKNGKEESEILISDVSLNNVKSILKIENENNEDTIEIPLGYKDGKIYLLKYNYTDEKSVYEKDIFTLNEDGSVEETGIQLPDYYTSGIINIYGNKIFCENRCFDWITGEDVTLFDDEDNDNITCAPVSGKNDWFLFSKNEGQEKTYLLYNIGNREYFKFNNNSSDEIQSVFYDSESNNFYYINSEYLIQKVNLGNEQFTAEYFDKLDYKKENEKNNNINYTSCNNGILYFGEGFENGINNFKNKDQNEFNVRSYSIADSKSEEINSINIYEYDRYYNDCVVVKRNDDESDGRLYFAKFKNSSPDIIMEIPKEYGNDSSISVNMNDSGNLLIQETYYDKQSGKIKNDYVVYDLNEYFTDNEYVLNDEGIWSGKEDENSILKYTFKNINDTKADAKQDLNEKDKINDNKSSVEENSDEKPKTSERIVRVDSSKDDDYREHDPSWKKGEVQWYYYNENNQKVTGWTKIGDDWYYFDNNGVMQKDAIVIEHGCEFTIDGDGKLVNPQNTEYLEKQNDFNKDNVDYSESHYVDDDDDGIDEDKSDKIEDDDIEDNNAIESKKDEVEEDSND